MSGDQNRLILPDRARARALLAQPPKPDWDGRLAETAEDRAERLDRPLRIRRERWAATVPPRFANATVADLTPARQHRDKVAEWIDRTDVQNLIITGTGTGTGKSHAAYAVANAAVARDVWTAAWTMIDLNTAFRPGNDPTAYERACNVDLLLLDDLGREKMTDWTIEQLQGVLDARYVGQRRTIMTTNLTGPECANRYGDPIMDRISDASWILRFEGGSRRKEADW